MTEKPADDAYDVAIIVGSEKSDVPVVTTSLMLSFLDGCRVRWRLAAISAHRHPDELLAFCRESGAGVFICAVSMNPGLPGAVAAATNQERPVIGVALPNANCDPDGSKCLAAMCMQPPGVPVLVAGVGNPGLINAAYAAAQIFAQDDMNIRERLAAHIESRRPVAKLNILK